MTPEERERRLSEAREWFQDNRVEADSIEQFLEEYYRPERYHDRGEDYAQALLAGHQEHFDWHGYDVISHHDSVTGRTVAWFGPPETPEPARQQRLIITEHDRVLEHLNAILDSMEEAEQLLDELSDHGGHFDWNWRWSQWNTIIKRVKRFKSAIVADQQKELEGRTQDHAND